LASSASFFDDDAQYYMYDYKGTAGSDGAFTRERFGRPRRHGNSFDFSLGGNVVGGIVYVSAELPEILRKSRRAGARRPTKLA